MAQGHAQNGRAASPFVAVLRNKGTQTKETNKMKKLMIAVAIVCAAAMSQAASINWGAATAANYVDKDGNVMTAATADAGKFVLVYLGNGTADWANATVVNEGSVAFGNSMGKLSAKASGTFGFTYGDAGAPVNNDIFGVMFKDSEGNLRQLETVDGAPILTEFKITGMGDNLYQGVMSFSESNYTVASVPEPTSGLLLLLGVAGMALRRRRA